MRSPNKSNGIIEKIFSNYKEGFVKSYRDSFKIFSNTVAESFQATKDNKQKAGDIRNMYSIDNLEDNFELKGGIDIVKETENIKHLNNQSNLQNLQKKVYEKHQLDKIVEEMLKKVKMIDHEGKQVKEPVLDSDVEKAFEKFRELQKDKMYNRYLKAENELSFYNDGKIQRVIEKDKNGKYVVDPEKLKIVKIKNLNNTVRNEFYQNSPEIVSLPGHYAVFLGHPVNTFWILTSTRPQGIELTDYDEFCGRIDGKEDPQGIILVYHKNMIFFFDFNVIDENSLGSLDKTVLASIIEERLNGYALLPCIDHHFEYLLVDELL